VLAINPTDAKAVLRRAKANIGRHEYQVGGGPDGLPPPSPSPSPYPRGPWGRAVCMPAAAVYCQLPTRPLQPAHAHASHSSREGAPRPPSRRAGPDVCALQAAQRDIAALQQLDPWCAELGALQLSLLTGQRTRQQERQLAEKMLRGLSMG
jgi:hypothetical protein